MMFAAGIAAGAVDPQAGADPGQVLQQMRSAGLAGDVSSGLDPGLLADHDS
jgi:hypothetical protein